MMLANGPPSTGATARVTRRYISYIKQDKDSLLPRRNLFHFHNISFACHRGDSGKAVYNASSVVQRPFSGSDAGTLDLGRWPLPFSGEIDSACCWLFTALGIPPCYEDHLRRAKARREKHLPGTSYKETEI